jgi:hypothetical protein
LSQEVYHLRLDDAAVVPVVAQTYAAGISALSPIIGRSVYLVAVQTSAILK